jgi:hypothetical protein
VLDGGRETIARDQPCLLLEIEERHNPGGLNRINDSLSAVGCGGLYFERGKRPARSFDRAGNELTSLAFETGNESRRNLSYINNFLYCSTQRNASRKEAAVGWTVRGREWVSVCFISSLQ